MVASHHVPNIGNAITPLTKETASIFKQAREMVRRKSLHKCWTGGGFVYVKKTETTPVPVKIVKSEDLRTL